MRISKDFTIITIADKYGNSWVGAAGNIDRDLLQLYGLLDHQGVEVDQRMPLVNLIEWCTTNGLTCRVNKRHIEVELP